MKRLPYLLCVVLAFTAWLFANWPTLHTLHQRWVDVGDSYVLGYPLIAVAAWFIYQRRHRLLALTPKPSWYGVAFFVASMLLIYTARLIQLQIVQQILLPISLWSAVFALAGWQIARAFVLPLALQYFGMPIWDFLIGVLQKMTIVIAHTVLAWLHVPAWLQGNRIHLPDGIITVADSCSGLNLLLAALLIATLQAEMGRYNSARRVGLFAAAAAIGLLDNWIRVIALILIAHYSHMQNALVYSHAAFGWWIYVVSLVPFFWIARRLEYRSDAHPTDTLVKAEAAPIPLWHLLAMLAAVALCQFGTTALAARSGRVQQMQIVGSARTIEPEFTPHYHGYDRRQTWELVSNGARYELSAFIYKRQQENKKLIYYDNVIATDAQLETVGNMRLNGHAINFAVVNAAPRRVVWWYYWIDGAITTSPLRAKLYQIKAALFGDPSAALVVLSEGCVSDDCGVNLQRAQDLANQTVFAQMLSIKGVQMSGGGN